jgi:hypothetical protein
MGTMRTITGMGITLRMVTDMITRVVPLTDTALGITRTCTTGIVSPFTAAAITAATAIPIENHRGLDLISGSAAIRLWCDTPDNAIGYAIDSTRSHDAVIRIYDHAGNVIETHKHTGDFKDCRTPPALLIV